MGLETKKQANSGRGRPSSAGPLRIDQLRVTSQDRFVVRGSTVETPEGFKLRF